MSIMDAFRSQVNQIEKVREKAPEQYEPLEEAMLALKLRSEQFFKALERYQESVNKVDSLVTLEKQKLSDALSRAGFSQGTPVIKQFAGHVLPLTEGSYGEVEFSHSEIPPKRRYVRRERNTPLINPHDNRTKTNRYLNKTLLRQDIIEVLKNCKDSFGFTVLEIAEQLVRNGRIFTTNAPSKPVAQEMWKGKKLNVYKSTGNGRYLLGSHYNV